MSLTLGYIQENDHTRRPARSIYRMARPVLRARPVLLVQATSTDRPAARTV